MKTGGIFRGPTALGTYGAFGATGQSCTPDNSALIMQVQTYLKSHGAPNLKVDGVWQGCTASAWNKVVGHQWVTCGDMSSMGIECSSDDCLQLGGIIAAFTLAGINACTDGSDGVATGTTTTTGVQQTQCASGQSWNAALNMCIQDIPGITSTNTGGGTTTPASGACPTGQTSILGVCVPNLTGGGASTTGGSGNQYCPSGSTLVAGNCVGTTGVTTPMPCPEGQTSILGMCVTNPFGGGSSGGGSSSGSCPAGQMNVPLLGCVTNPLATTSGGSSSGSCPAGQMNVPILGCVANPFGSSGGSGGSSGSSVFGNLLNTIGGLFGQGVNCPAGSVYDAASKGCMSASGPVSPLPKVGTTTLSTVSPTSIFGSMGWVIVGLLGIGVAATGYYVWKKHKLASEGFDAGAGFDESEWLDPSLGLTGDDFGGGFDEFGGDYGGYGEYGMYPNRGRKGKKSRRSRRHGRKSRR